MAFAYAQGQQQSNSAPKVGECAKQVGENDVAVVPCGAPEATLKVTSRHDNTTNGDAACAGDASATSYYSFEERSRGSSLVSFVLCFEDV